MRVSMVSIGERQRAAGGLTVRVNRNVVQIPISWILPKSEYEIGHASGRDQLICVVRVTLGSGVRGEEQGGTIPLHAKIVRSSAIVLKPKVEDVTLSRCCRDVLGEEAIRSNGTKMGCV